MPRQAPRIRDAVPEDAAELLELWAATNRYGSGSAGAQEDAEQALANLAAEPDERLLVAVAEDRIVASIKLARGPMTPLMMEPAVHTSFLLVLPEVRRHGYGHALMEAAVTWAEEKDINQVTAIIDGNRETNRFFARLGLITLGTVRYTSVAGLRKKLTSDRAGVGGGNRHLVQVLAQRRSMRRRQESS